MAVTVNHLTKVISVPQADLTFVTGTLYELDTNWFRLQISALLAAEDGMPWEDILLHNTEVTVAGTTFARTIEIINGYSIEFTPDLQWSVRLIGSNNNLFDIENGILVQNQVQVIAQNSAGLITTGSTMDSIAADLAFIRKIEAGRWKIVGNQMIFYDIDNVTPIATFNLFDGVGSPTEDSPKERFPA